MVDSSLVKRFGFPLGTVEYPANVFSFISEAAESQNRVFYHLNYLIINVGRMHAAFYRLYLYLVFIGTSEYFSWFLISSSPSLALDLVAPLPVEERPDVRRGVHHAGEAELALWIPCCCPAILGFVGLWLWVSSRYDVRIQTNLPHKSILTLITPS